MENSYFAQEHGINQVKVNKPKKGVSIPTFIISLIMVACLVVLLFLKWDDIMGFFGAETGGEEVEVQKGLSVGDEIAFSGSIKNDGDMVNYTHSYLSLEYGVIGLKSSKLNLNNFSQDVYFEGIVEKISHEIPIVNVTKIYDLEENEPEFTGDIIETGDDTEISDKYLSKLGLYFGEKFFEKYTLVNEGDGSSLKVKNLDTNIIYTVYYFKCNPSNSSEHCDDLNSFYSKTSSKKFVDKYGVNYYKDAEFNSWFFSNDSLFGFRINDEEESFVRDLSTLITVINKTYAEKNILPNVKSLCEVSHNSIENVNKSDFSYKNGNFYYSIEGTNSDGKLMACELRVDPKSKSFAQVESVEVINSGEGEDIDTTEKEEGDKETDKESEVDTKEPQAYIWDTDVEQFPINLDKKLTFTSSRGHSFVFPSSKIAYQGINVSENFDQVGVNCFSAMNVVKYEDKELVETQGNVVIYECNIKNGFDDSDRTLIYKNVGDKHFVIKINDPAWVDFANNIEIVA